MVCRFYRKFILLFLTLAVTGCATMSFDQPKSHTTAFTDTSETKLGKGVTQWVDDHDGLSGFHPLAEGMDALGVRLRLAEAAEKSIDLQYFLMKGDTAGSVMITALIKAADRGVRVRFLLDDIFTSAPDRALLLLNQHPNIEVRLFNPISRRGFALLNFLGDFRQANRRMHNKSFTVDNQISVVGGRNIANEYFDIEADSVFVDFDVIALGPITREISSSFDEFWNHSRAVPMQEIAKSEEEEKLEEIKAEVAEELKNTYTTVYKKAIESDLLQAFISDQQEVYPARARILSDSPDKIVNEISQEHMLLANDLKEVLLRAKKEIVFISPYYIPGKDGIELLKTLINNGVRVIILTNSLASNNHVPVHGAYSRYRKDVIKAGAELYEARANAVDSQQGSKSLTLHTKAILIDGRYLFVGSLNLDPRSIDINAEMGLLIDSKEMLDDMILEPDEALLEVAYRVLLNENGQLEWHGVIDGEKVVETKEPLTSRWLRFKAWFMKIAPESQL